MSSQVSEDLPNTHVELAASDASHGAEASDGTARYDEMEIDEPSLHVLDPAFCDPTTTLSDAHLKAGIDSLKGVGLWSNRNEPWSIINRRTSGLPQNSPFQMLNGHRSWESHPINFESSGLLTTDLEVYGQSTTTWQAPRTDIDQMRSIPTSSYSYYSSDIQGGLWSLGTVEENETNSVDHSTLAGQYQAENGTPDQLIHGGSSSLSR